MLRMPPPRGEVCDDVVPQLSVDFEARGSSPVGCKAKLELLEAGSKKVDVILDECALSAERRHDNTNLSPIVRSVDARVAMGESLGLDDYGLAVLPRFGRRWILPQDGKGVGSSQAPGAEHTGELLPVERDACIDADPPQSNELIVFGDDHELGQLIHLVRVASRYHELLCVLVLA